MDGFKEFIKTAVKRIIGAARRPFHSILGYDEEPDEKRRFVDAWADIFKSDADVFTGLYAGLDKISAGAAKKPERVFNEWRGRTRYKWESEPIYKITEELFGALEDDADKYKQCADLLLEAAENAGIVKDEEEYITLDEHNTAAYIEWDGAELATGDTVEIITPARYLNGRVLEQGYCRNNQK